MSVKRILENPVYIGTLIQGKTTTASYRDKRRFKRDPSELIAFKNSHEAIISKTTFLIVQDLMRKDSYTKDFGTPYIFSGFYICGNCGRPLHHTYIKNRKKQGYMVCRCINVNCECKARLKEEVLKKAVFETLKKHIEIVLNYSEPAMRSEFEQNINRTNFELKKLENHFEKLEQLKENLLTQMKSGVISESDYNEICEFYDDKISKIKSEMERIRNEKMGLLDCIDEIRSKYKEYFNCKELTRSMFVTFVEMVEVFGNSKIRIHFRYEDFFKPYSDGDINGS